MAQEKKLVEDLVQLARLSLKGDQRQVEAYVRRLGRSLMKDYSEAATSLTELAGAGGVMRKADAADRGGASRLVPVDQESRLELLTIENAPHAVPPPVLDPFVSDQVEQVIRERKRITELLDAGLEPSRTILFTGAPGVGKTFTAHWVAERLNKPLFTLNLASVMSSLLGKTGSNLRSVLEYAKANDCVLLLDEFDAVAKRRNDESEVGELKRLVTVILQEIDRWPSNRLLIAATNHGELLDPAVWRRFDAVVNFPMPNTQILRNLLNSELLGEVSDPLIRALSIVLAGKSFSDVSRAIRGARRQSILTDKALADLLVGIITTEMAGLSKSELKAAGIELEAAGVPQRLVSEITGLSRDTLRRARTTEGIDG